MKVLLAGGGTAGHINPALSIANQIKLHHPDAEFLFAAVPGGMEERLVPQAGYPIAQIKIAGFRRSFLPEDILHNLKAASYLACSDLRAKKIIRDFSPDVVIGTGGYLSGPIVRRAHKDGIPTLIHEQNAFPGVTTKLLSKNVDRVMLAFPEAEKYLPPEARCAVVGNPVRQEFLSADKKKAREMLGLDDHFTILSFGGSLGAMKINEIAADLMEWHIKEGKINHIHGYGKNGVETFPQLLSQRGISLAGNRRIKALEYIDNIYLYVAAADLVISRAGASSLVELEVTGKPSVLVPYPYAAENHQYYNAKALEDKGAAILIEEKNYDKKFLVEKVRELSENREKRNRMSQNAKSLAVYDTAEKIYQLVMEVCQKG